MATHGTHLCQGSRHQHNLHSKSLTDLQTLSVKMLKRRCKISFCKHPWPSTSPSPSPPKARSMMLTTDRWMGAKGLQGPVLFNQAAMACWWYKARWTGLIPDGETLEGLLLHKALTSTVFSFSMVSHYSISTDSLIDFLPLPMPKMLSFLPISIC